MKTKPEYWTKGSFEVKLDEEENSKIMTGWTYKFFGIVNTYKFKEFYHIPTKTLLSQFGSTLKEMKKLVDKLLTIEIDWSATEKTYYYNIDNEIRNEINKIMILEKYKR